jgi:molecular chaperone HtpG
LHIEAAKDKGYDVLQLDGQLDVHWVGLLEQKLKKTRFVRVDSDIIEHIIQKEDIKEVELTDEQKESLTQTVKAQIPVIANTEFGVDFKSLGENSKPIQITQNEFSRRMKEMAAMQQQMAFYGEMPDTYQVVLNVQHPLIKELMNSSKEKDKETLLNDTTSDGKLKHLVDLALLSNGMLKGEALSNFVKRSFDMI